VIRKPGFYIWIYILLAIPLLFIRVSNSHDWGDDFAQYLLQSKYLTGEITDLPVSATWSHGPQVKGILFSLLLTPATALTDAFEIKAGKLIVSISLVLTGLMLFLYFRREFGEFNSLLLSLVVIYNFQFIRLKDQILPDFYLAAMVLLSAWLFSSSNRKSFLLSLVVAGLSVGIKSAGLALVLSAAILIVLGKHHTLKTRQDKWKALAVLAFPVIALYLAEALISSEKPSLIWYSIVTAKSSDFMMVTENFSSYKNGLFSYFEFEIPMFLNLVIRWVLIPFFIAGFLYSLFKKPGLAELFVLIYFLFLLFYPYSKDPLRFLIPAVPLILCMIVKIWCLITTRIQLRYVLTLILMLLTAATFQTFRLELKREITYSTENIAADELFEFLKTGTEKGSLVADTKPWAVSYFTGVKTVPFGAAYLADYRILRYQLNGTFPEPVLSGDSVIFKNDEFEVIANQLVDN
jgi:hypothetical protein